MVYQTRFDFDFMKYRLVFGLASLGLIVFSIFIWIQKGDSKYGVDFAGGAEVVAQFSNPISIDEVRTALNNAGFVGAVVQAFVEESHQFSIRLASTEDSEVGKKIADAVSAIQGQQVTILKQDYVGPVVGELIRKDGIKAFVIAMFCILAYISFRFEWRFAVGAVIAVIHDMIITAGLYVFAGKEVSVAVLAAVLTIGGYSLNDTIIVFDRLRENIIASRKKSSKDKDVKLDAERKTLLGLINDSVNQTLNRTLLTSLITLFVVAALWVFGGGAIEDLSLTLLIGVVVGTYSSIFIASAAVYYLARA